MLQIEIQKVIRIDNSYDDKEEDVSFFITFYKKSCFYLNFLFNLSNQKQLQKKNVYCCMPNHLNIEDFVVLIDKNSEKCFSMLKSYYDYLMYREQFFDLDAMDEEVWVYELEDKDIATKESKRKLKDFYLAEISKDNKNNFLEFDRSKIKLYQDLETKTYYSFKQDIYQEIIKNASQDEGDLFHKKHLFFNTSFNSETNKIDINKEDIKVFKFNELKKISI